MREFTVRVSGGRTLQAVEDGDPRGRPVFSLHGTPGARMLYPKHVADAASQGIRLIGYDRPGYGGSSALPGRRVVGAAADVAAIADHLRLDRFAVWGHSGGGAPALACAAALPERVVAAACLAGVAPYPAQGIDWVAGMGELNVDDFELMLRDRAAWEAKLEKDRQEMLEVTADQLTVVFASLLSEVDRAAFTPELGEFFLRQAREGLKDGTHGVRDDNLSETLPWGFDLGAIRPPVQLWHGRHDRFVPYSHGEWLASRLGRADVHLEPNEGHVSLYRNRIPEVHRWLVSHF